MKFSNLIITAISVFFFMIFAGIETDAATHTGNLPDAVESKAAIFLLDISELPSETIDLVCARPEVEGWVELGGTLILAGDNELGDELSNQSFDAPLSKIQKDPDTLWLARLNSRNVPIELCPEADLIIGLGRYAVISVTCDTATALQKDANPNTQYEPLPWNTSLICRADRFASPTARTATTPIVSAAVEAFDLDYYTRIVTDLVDFGTRYTYVSTFPNVTNYLKDELEALGFTVRLDPYQISGYTRHNVVAEIIGDVTPDDVYIVCGHFDSVSESSSTFAPGADDNASGAGAVIEIARVLKQYRFDSTVRFICFSGEEQGLVGSSAYVDDLIASGEIDDIKGVFNMDMIAYLNTSVWDVLLEGHATVSQENLQLLADLVPQYTSLTSYVSTNPYGSDHMPFIYEDINAVLTIEYEDWYNPHYHSTSDTMSTLTMPFAGEIVKLNIAATAVQAGIKGGYMLQYGTGLEGSGGVTPLCSGSGSSNLGDDFTVDLEQGLGGALSLFVFGPTSAGLPFFGGTFLVDPVGAIFTMLQLGGAAGVPGDGSLPINVTTPNDPSLTGVSIFIQFVVDDDGAVKGLSLSNGLELVIGI